MADFNNRFAVPPINSETPTTDSRTRRFTADGTEFLKVPGLTGKLERIVLQHGATRCELPLTETRRYPIDGLLLEFETVEEPLVSTLKAVDGTPLLLRSKLSNHGYWPKGTEVFVTADWEQAPPLGKGRPGGVNSGR